MQPLRIATRGTELALRRARAIQAMLEARGLESGLVTIRTEGDKHFDEPFHASGGRTLFTHELEQALLRNRADVAVHAYADMPSDATPGLAIAAVPARGDARDALVLNELLEGATIEELPRGTRIGTSSARCRALLLALAPHIEAVQLRGNLLERLRKVDDGQVHATIASADALHTLGVSQRIAGYLDAPHWLPAPAQGALALQVREGDAPVTESLTPLGDTRTAIDVAAERSFFAALEGGPQSPLAALVVHAGDSRTLHGLISDPDGRTLLRAEHVLDVGQPELAGIRLANALREKGASRLLDLVRRADRFPTPQPDSV